MPNITAAPRAFKNAVITLGLDSFQAHVSSALFADDASDTSWTGLDGATHTDSIAGKTTLTLAVVQDWHTAASLCNYLFENAGDTVAASIKYIDGPTFASTVTLVKPAIGGVVNTFNESTVVLPSTAPTKTNAPAV